MLEFFDQIPSFWRGVLASITASMILAVLAYSATNISASLKDKQARQKKLRRQLIRNLHEEPQNIIATYNVIIARTLKCVVLGLLYVSLGTAASGLSLLVAIPIYLGGILYFFFALRWIAIIGEAQILPSTAEMDS